MWQYSLRRTFSRWVGQGVRESLETQVSTLHRRRAALQTNLEKAEQERGELREKAEILVANIHTLKSQESLLKKKNQSVVTVEGYNSQGEMVQHRINLKWKKYRSIDEHVAELFKQAKRVERTPDTVREVLCDVGFKLDFCSTILEKLKERENEQQQRAVETPETETEEDSEKNEEEFRYLQEIVDAVHRETGIKLDGLDPVVEHQKKPRSKKAVKKQDGKPRFRRFEGDNGAIIWVGRTREENDQLSMKFSKSTDVWMHAQGLAGSHVIIRTPSGKLEDITQDTLQKAANLAALHCKMGHLNEVPITVSLAKYLRKPKRAPVGAVRLLKELAPMTGFPNMAPRENIT